MNTSFASLEAERDARRKEYGDLFDQKSAIIEQMRELTGRLQELDDLIAKRDATQQSQTQTYEEAELKIEERPPVVRPSQNRKRAKNTQLDETLTDPTSQIDDGDVLTDSDDGSNGGSNDSKRRVTKSPVAKNSTEGRSGNRRSSNPFGDLFGSNQRGNGNSINGNTWNLNQNTARPSSLENWLVKGKPSTSSVQRLPPANVRQQGGASIFPNTAGSSGGNAIGGNQPPWHDRMMHHLRKTFKLESFRENQEAICNATLSGRDCFVIMRTGGGKSLTYQLPALIESELDQHPRKISIVISPLISLIRDQEEQMNAIRRGSALSFTSNMQGGSSEHARRWGLVRDPNAGVCLIFVTPEKVSKSGKLKGELEKLNGQGRLGRFVIDECHCACQWGCDFRPDYAKLGILKHHFPRIPLLAVTATASERVRVDCLAIFKSRNSLFFRSTASRPNLHYSVLAKSDNKQQVVDDMAQFIKENHRVEAGIIYTFSKREANETADKLCAKGIVARAYHADVDDRRKDQIQRSWMRNETQVVVATIAFGLGINKPDVRFVLHHSISKTLEAYYQESGRAGRDGLSANCVLFYSPKDVSRLLGMVHGESGENNFWGMVRYGQMHGDNDLCHHTILTTLGEVNDLARERMLKAKCKTNEEREIGRYAQTVVRIVDAHQRNNERCTLNQIVTKWRSKSVTEDFSFLKDNYPKDFSKDECERIVVSCLLSDLLKPDIQFGAYATNVYIVLGRKGRACMNSPDPRGQTSFPLKSSKKKSGGKTPLDVTNTKKKKRTSKLKSSSRSKRKSTSRSKKPRRKSNSIEVVQIDSSSEDEEFLVKRQKRSDKRSWLDDDSSSDGTYNDNDELSESD